MPCRWLRRIATMLVAPFNPLFGALSRQSNHCALQVAAYEAGHTAACVELQQKARKLTEKTLEACQYRRLAPGQVSCHVQVAEKFQVQRCRTSAAGYFLNVWAVEPAGPSRHVAQVPHHLAGAGNLPACTNKLCEKLLQL